MNNKIEHSHELKKFSWQKKNIPNLTGTSKAYHPNKNDEKEYIRDEKEKEARHANKLYCKIKVLIIYTKEQQEKFGKVRGNQNTFCTPSKAFWKPI